MLSWLYPPLIPHCVECILLRNGAVKKSYWTDNLKDISGIVKIFPGEAAFKLIDSMGFPYEILIEELRERGGYLDVISFMVCALRSKNFKVKRLYNMMLNEHFTKEMFDDCMKYILIKKLI